MHLSLQCIYLQRKLELKEEELDYHKTDNTQQATCMYSATYKEQFIRFRKGEEKVA